jgi:hypothetical protein
MLNIPTPTLVSIMVEEDEEVGGNVWIYNI